MVNKKILVIGLMLCSLKVPASKTSTSDVEADAFKATAILVTDTLNSNPGIRSGQAALDVATAREQANNQPLYNPELEIEAEDAVDQSVSVGISQTFDWRNKRGARSGIASFEREAAVAELHQLRQSLAFELLGAITRHDVVNRLSTLANERERLMREFAALASQRRDLGDLNQVEFDLAQLALAEAQLQLADTAIRLSEATQALKAIIGDKELSLSPLPATPPNVSISTPDLEDILYSLPGIRVQLARIAAAKGVVKLRSLEKYPDPTVGVRVGQEESEVLAGVTVSIPLYIRNRFKAEIDVADAELIQLEMEGQDMYQRAHAQLVTSLERYRLAENAWMNWVETGQPSLGNQLNVLERLWRAGEISTTDYLVQVNQTLDTRTAAAELRGRVWLSWFDWLAASGQVEEWLNLSAAK